MTLEQDLRKALTAGAGGARVARGQVVTGETGGLEVVVEGSRPPVRALGRVALREGQAVGCVLLGQQWYVIGVSTDRLAPLPFTGRVTAVTAGSPTVTVTAGGGTYQARFVAGTGWTPAVGQDVYLTWPDGEGFPVAHGTLGTVPAPPASEPPPAPSNPTRPPVQTGSTSFTATDSGTWSSGAGTGWNAYYGRHLLQGTYSGQWNQGAWWYGGRPRDTLRGRTVTRARLRLPARRRVGNYNAAVPIHVYRHDQNTRGGLPSRVAGPHDLTIPAGFGGGWFTIPTSWGQAIVDSGGGLAIYGDPYAGLTGVGSAASGLDPASGQLRLDWQR